MIFYICGGMADVREFNVAEATDLAHSSRSTGAVLVNPPTGVARDGSVGTDNRHVNTLGEMETNTDCRPIAPVRRKQSGFSHPLIMLLITLFLVCGKTELNCNVQIT